MSASLTPSRMSAQGYKNRAPFFVVCEAGTEYKSVLAPAFWAHVAASLRPYDRIEVVSEDGAFYAELLVRSVRTASLDVVELRHVELDGKVDIDLSRESKYRYQYRGPHSSHSVIRVADNEVVAENLPSKDAAIKWIDSQERAEAA